MQAQRQRERDAYDPYADYNNNDKVFAQLEIITPERAKDLLLCNINNRRIRPKKVIELSGMMKSGQWKTNGATIAISKDGKLLDGQHRLTMVVETGRPLETLVAYNVEDDAFDTIDTGLKKNGADSLYTHTKGKIKWAAAIAGGLNVLNLFQTSQGKFVPYLDQEKKMNPHELIKIYDRTPEIDENLLQIQQWKTLSQWIAPSTLLGLYTYTKQLDPELSKRFWDTFDTGANLSLNSPVNALRTRFINYSIKNGGKAPRRLAIALVVKAWNARKKNQAIPSLRIRLEDTPEFDIT